LEEALDLSFDRLLMMMIVTTIMGEMYQSIAQFHQDNRPY